MPHWVTSMVMMSQFKFSRAELNQPETMRIMEHVPTKTKMGEEKRIGGTSPQLQKLRTRNALARRATGPGTADSRLGENFSFFHVRM
jgi:hypothetical protein